MIALFNTAGPLVAFVAGIVAIVTGVCKLVEWFRRRPEQFVLRLDKQGHVDGQTEPHEEALTAGGSGRRSVEQQIPDDVQHAQSDPHGSQAMLETVEEEDKAVLRVLGSIPGEAWTPARIATAVGQTESVVWHRCSSLCSRKLARLASSGRDGPKYMITPAGQELLMKLGEL